MTSKEALKEFYNTVTNEAIDKAKYLGEAFDNIQQWQEKYRIIDKDLYRLERLEAIEDEIEIFLTTLFDIYKKLCEQKTVYMKIGYQTKCFEYDSYLIDFKNKEIVCMEYEPENWLPFKDYGITWALSREGLI